jgi:hypothetical protein
MSIPITAKDDSAGLAAAIQSEDGIALTFVSRRRWWRYKLKTRELTTMNAASLAAGEVEIPYSDYVPYYAAKFAYSTGDPHPYAIWRPPNESVRNRNEQRVSFGIQQG